MRQITGDKLTPADQKQALAMYVNRYTKQHKPAWATDFHPVQFEDDYDWLRNTLFYVTKAGRLDKRAHFCYSLPTWPGNPELRYIVNDGNKEATCKP